MFTASPVLYRDEGGAPAGAPAAAAPAKDFAGELLRALEERIPRAEKGVVRSMAEQHGITEAEAMAALEKYRADKAAALPEAAQKQIEVTTAKARALLIAAEVKSAGAALGLVDAEAALLLLPKEEQGKIRVDDAGTVTGVKEALEALQKSRPYLFLGAARPMAMAQRVGGASPGALTALEEKFYARNPELRPK